jgi:hypothetical protein
MPKPRGGGSDSGLSDDTPGSCCSSRGSWCSSLGSSRTEEGVDGDGDGSGDGGGHAAGAAAAYASNRRAQPLAAAKPVPVETTQVTAQAQAAAQHGESPGESRRLAEERRWLQHSHAVRHRNRLLSFLLEPSFNLLEPGATSPGGESAPRGGRLGSLPHQQHRGRHQESKTKKAYVPGRDLTCLAFNSTFHVVQVSRFHYNDGALF